MIWLSAMRYLGAVVAGMVGAAAGWFVTGALAAWIAGLYGMSDFEGERGMFAALFVGPIGGLVCMIVAIWGALRIGKGRPPLGATLGRLGLVVAGIAAIVGGGIGLRLLTLDTYSNEAPPTLEFELRVPASMRLPDREAVRVELHTDRNVGDSYFSDPWLRTEGDHQVIAGGVPLMLKTSSRLLVVTLPDQPARLFKLGLSRNPASTPAFGEWRGPDFVDAPGSDRPRAAPAHDPVQLRHRVSRPGE
jgi:hypothetical protein